MRRLLRLVVAALLVTCGLTAASAAARDCGPYVDDCDGLPVHVTVTMASKKVPAGHRPVATVDVKSYPGQPTAGTLTFVLTQVSSKRTWRTTKHHDDGTPVTYRGPRLTKRGAYILRVSFTRTGAAISGRGAATFRVVKKKHRRHRTVLPG